MKKKAMICAVVAVILAITGVALRSPLFVTFVPALALFLGSFFIAFSEEKGISLMVLGALAAGTWVAVLVTIMAVAGISIA